MYDDALFDEGLAVFSAVVEPPPPGYVRRAGKIFECGDYPKHKPPFSLTEEEADRAIANFSPVKADIEHRPSILDGKLGELRRVWRVGKDIIGAADVPEWLVSTVDNHALGVSCGWDTEDKSLVNYAFVLEPAIGGAALVAEFSKANTSIGKESDGKAQAGVQKKRGKLMSVGKKLSAMFANFSANSDAPATGSAGAGSDVGAGSNQPSQGSSGSNGEGAGAGAGAGNAGNSGTNTGADAGAGQQIDTDPKGTSGTNLTGQNINFSAPGYEEDDDEPVIAEFRTQQIINRARSEADALVQGGYLFSSGRNAAIALFSQLGYDNEKGGPSVATFSKGDGQVINDRVELFKEVMRSVPKHALFAHQMPVTIYNGERDPKEKKTAQQQGEEQAARFVANMLPPEPPHQNGHNGH